MCHSGYLPVNARSALLSCSVTLGPGRGVGHPDAWFIFPLDDTPPELLERSDRAWPVSNSRALTSEATLVL